MDIKFDDIADALAAIRSGECVVVVDDETRENEGDLICAAQFATPEQINFMATEARGLICLAMEGARLDELDLPLMVDRNTDSNQTAFTISIDAGSEHGVTTGISAEDRAKTIQVALNPKTKPQDLRRPGHIFPLRARTGGVLKRAGHTEAAVDLSQLAGLSASGVICEIQNQDGSMARLQELNEYAKKWNLKIISIADLIRFRLENERFVYRRASANLPSLFGGFTAIGYTNELDGTEHVALVKGNPGELKEPVLVRMHSECLTGDAFGSLRCDCRPQLEAALSQINKEGEGVVVYLRQEGRGIGLINKLKAYSLQDGGLDTVEANERLGFAADLRNYGVGAQILTDLRIKRLRLLTNNPRKIAGLGGYGLKVETRIPLVISPSDHNTKYLEAKKKKLGHLIEKTSSDATEISSFPFIIIFWDGETSSENLASISKNAKNIAIKHNMKLIDEFSTRLLALSDNPKFTWKVNITDVNNPEPIFTNLIKNISYILSDIAKWDSTLKLGIIKSANEEQVLHPPQNLQIINHKLKELVLNTSNPIEDLINNQEPNMIIWD